ncbi:hypothetical protein [Calothrix sp. 336/3]|uniref:hypothetical protein n=1 Tax=Calothrix sp. 336/3 TaxID=1337936 RepID=UPI0004E29250|nr:hypothetical protein [Calothrix sp. 336/3]AKG24921.1 hypothetical protein IJ00_26645 [Calothrix sp. 336/3]
MQTVDNINLGNIKVRNLEPWVVPALSHQATEAGYKTLEGFVRQLLQAQALRPQNDFAKEVQQHLDAMQQKYGLLPDGFTDGLVRDIRDEKE